jgi:hypothetical protein
MAGNPLPKPPGQVRRRNADQPGWKTIPADGSGLQPPPLPNRDPDWSERTIDWWRTVWASPMATIWLPADMGALHRLAELMELFSRGELSGATEIRNLEDRFGLSPRARQMLRWQVGKPDKQDEPPADENEKKKPPAQTTVRRLRAVDPGA